MAPLVAPRLVALLAAVVGLILPSAAQARGTPADTTGLQEHFLRGIEAVEAERYAEATHLLSAVFTERPTLYTSETGSAAYWLAEALAAAGRADLAQRIRTGGIEALEAVDAFDIRLVEAYVRAVYRAEAAEAYTTAAGLYLALLEAAPGASPAEQPTLHRLIGRTLLLLPETLLESVVDGRVSTLEGRLRDGWSLRPGAGPALAAWWRSLDPLPATVANERLEEHLRRITHAETTYPAPEHLTGLDGRGLLYLRLGPPDAIVDVTYQDQRLTRLVAQAPLLTTASSLPDVEIWTYDVHPDAYFLFTEAHGRVDLATFRDLQPGVLSTRRRLQSAPRQGAQAVPSQLRLYLETLRVIYTDLATVKPDLAPAIADLENLVFDMDNGTRLPGGQYMPPASQAQSILNDIDNRDVAAITRREEQVPRQATGLLDETALLPMQVRWARFLEGDGTTRAEIYWSLPAAALAAASPDDALQPSLLEHTTTVRNAAYGREAVYTDAMRVGTGSPVAGGIVPVQTLTIAGLRGVFHLASQWNQLLIFGDRAVPQATADAPVQQGFFRADSLTALSNDAASLEISDLLPLYGPDVALTAPDDRSALTPYPFERLSQADTVGLYFEVYHLAFDTDDQTRYTVAYEVRRPEGGGLLDRLRRSRIRASTQYEGQARTARELIQITLDDAVAGGSVEVVVQVTDDVTGQSVTRTIAFGPDPR